MRGMHSKLRIGGLAAVVSATTLVLPVIAITSAQAAPSTSTATAPTAPSHNVQVDTQEAFAELAAGTTSTVVTAYCSPGYIATDGSLLLDGVDPEGFYSDIVVTASERVGLGTDASPEGWRVTADNLGDARAQGKVSVTCLKKTFGGEHAHSVASYALGGTQETIWKPAGDFAEVTRSCTADEVPFAPVYDAVGDAITILKSYRTTASSESWTWIVDKGDAENVWFGLSCLKSDTTQAAGVQAATLTSKQTAEKTLSVGADQRGEDIVTCEDAGRAIVGSYKASDTLLFLGKQGRGTAEMFRFYNGDATAAPATMSVTCLGQRTAGEEPPAPPAGPEAKVTVGDVVRSGAASLTLKDVTCTAATTCKFTVRIIKDKTVVATKATSLKAGKTLTTLKVPTTKAGRSLKVDDKVDVKIKSNFGVSTYSRTLKSS